MLKNSIDTIEAMNLQQYSLLYKNILNKIKEIELPLSIIRTYITEITSEIPYLSCCYLMSATPYRNSSTVDILALENPADFAFTRTALQYLNQ